MKSLDPVYSQLGSTHDEPRDKDLDLKGDNDSPQPGVQQDHLSWVVIIRQVFCFNFIVSVNRSKQCIMGRLIPPD